MEDERGEARPSIRWWPLVVILLLVAASAMWGWVAMSQDRQRGNIMSVGVAVLGAIAIWLWLLFFARASWTARKRAFVAGLALPAIFFALFRYEGVTGDLLPIFEWRFAAASPLDEPRERSAAGGDEAARDNASSTTAGGASQPGSKAADKLRDASGLGDFLEFFGPHRRGVLAGPELARDWKAQPPVELWRIRVGEAWSGFAVSGRHAITQEQDGDEELVTCRDTIDGTLRWTHRYEAHYESGVAGDGPRATPTIDGQRVYTLGSTGVLCCLDLASGKPQWTKDLRVEHGVPIPPWGFAGSPLVSDGLCIVSAGSDGSRLTSEDGGVKRGDDGNDGTSLVAYDSTNGKLVWKRGVDKAHWSSPLVAELLGVRQVLIFNEHSVASHALADGRILWEREWNPRHAHATMPRVFGEDRVLISSGYGEGAEMIRVQRSPAGEWSSERVWRSRHLKAKFANFVDLDGFVYALDDGILACVDPKTGRRRWKNGRYGHGQMLLVGDLLLLSSESGAVVLLEPKPDLRRELARIEVFDHKLWNPPALAGRFLLVRTAREAACYRLPVAKAD